MELFVELDELDESLLKKAVSLRAPKWYTRSNPIQQEDHLLNHGVVHPKVVLHPISTENKLPN